MMKKHNIQNASAFATKQLGNKLNKVLTRKEKQQLDEQDAKTKWYLELTIAACLGAALALGFVAAHQMIVTEWTW
tara:strand:+ start:176 stop:400 length:225 start_codon:yes stop_codon:yes gene_type:complete